MNLVNQYKAYVSGKLDFAEALQQHLGKKKYLAPAVIEKLAEAHAESYGEKYHRTIFFQPTRNGTWVFYTDESCTREFRDDTATRQWQRDVQIYQQLKGSKTKTTRKSVDPIQAEAKRLGNKFSKTEIKRLIKVLTANV
jgi:hypothetical protein